MKKWRVEVMVHGMLAPEVEAETEDGAKEIAECEVWSRVYGGTGLPAHFVYASSVEEIEEWS